MQAEKDELAAFRDAAQAETAALREELHLCNEVCLHAAGIPLCEQ